MKKLIYNDLEYPNLLHKNSNSLIKISTLPAKVWKNFCNKNLKYVNRPIRYHAITKQDKKTYNIQQSQFSHKRSIVILPYLQGYQPLFNTTFKNNFTTKEILQLLKKNINILKNIHQNGVTHCDLHTSNIMINKCHDIELIDWDSGTFDDYISEENTYFDDKISTEDIIKKTIQQDKFDLLLMYFSYLRYGDFKHEIPLLTRSLNLESLELS